MPGHTSHGKAYIEPERHDELSDGVPDGALQEQARAEHKAGAGRIPKGASAIATLGGKSRKGKTYLSHSLDSTALPPEDIRRARTLRNANAAEIAATVGGGECGVGASLLLKFCAQKTAAAEAAFRAGDFETFRKLSESARMDLMYAREHAAKTALARRDGGVDQWDPLANARRELAAKAGT